MELMDCSLYTFVKRDGPIPLHSALSILHDVSLGLWYLHTHNPPVMHYNLTPDHVLVNASPLMAKIADLGEVIPENFDPDDDRIPGIPVFMPGALYDDQLKNYSTSSDIFSYGGVALYTIVGEWPVPSGQVKLDPKTRKRVVLSEVERRQQYLDKMIGEAEVLRPLVEECLDDDPARRPTAGIVSERINQAKTLHMDNHPETKVISVYSYNIYACNAWCWVATEAVNALIAMTC